MRALVLTAAGVVRMRDEPPPAPVAGEALVDVVASGICGSELHGFRSLGMRQPPLIMGHEFVGTLADGSRVVVNPLLTCGECRACRAGRESLCERRQLLGVHRPGGFAETVAVPETAVHPLPDTLDWTAGALIEPLANAVHAYGLTGSEPGESGSTVGVIGAGAIGLVCLLVALHHGHQVVVADPSPQRRALAERLGAHAVTDIETGAPPGGFDTTIDAVGVPATRCASVQQLRAGGTSVWLGLASTVVDFDGAALVRSEQRIVGSFAYSPNDFRAAVELAPLVDLSWATDIPLEQAADVFLQLADGRTDIVKAVLRTPTRA